MARRVFVKLAARNLRRHWRRTLITLAAVAVGLASLVFLWGYVDGTNRQMITNITGYLTGHLQVHQRGYHDDPTLDLAFGAPGGIAARLAALPAVAAVAPRIEGEALASGPEKTRGVFVVGVDPRYEDKVTTLARAIKDGRYLDAADTKGVVLGDRVAEVLRVRVGDEIALVTQAADGSVGAARYRVRGIYDSGIDLIDEMYVFLPLAAAQELYALESRITTLALKLDDIDAVARTAAALGRELGAEFEALGWRRLMPGMAADVDFHEMLANIILFVVLVIVTLGIANTILMGVLERTHELGVMMALGTGRGQIARVVLYEAFLLGVAGIALGIALGLAVVGYFGRYGIDLTRYSEATQLMPGLTGIVYPGIGLRQLAWLSALVLVATLVASIYPAVKAAGLTPVEAIQGAGHAVRFRLRRMSRGLRASNERVAPSHSLPRESGGGLGFGGLGALASARELLTVPAETATAPSMARGPRLDPIGDAATIAVRLNDIEAAEVVATALAGSLTATNQQVVPWSAIVPEILQMLDLIRVNLRVVLIVIFIVVALGVTNTLLMAVLERTREFGLQLALGTRPGQIVRTVLYESLLLGALGLSGGALIGAVVVGYYQMRGFDLSDYAAGAAAIPGMTTVVYPAIDSGNVRWPVLGLMVTSVIAALYPAWRAARLDPVQALRHA